ncbi:hybrid sensor histidine kinase/response regulator [Pleurocapsa sp. CCALA 161]|uniref:hybrid sensor histidine kinase/response regulator n=1 Tax=Pleurocapsa sp. CCALA 161 TaxID=2107688 RepID=UPI000D0778F1|nr:hybrid sensor histidine kinase/response regulator [Pleurocapsa sp. CCALA 161]PSB09106.1 hybrid sensor histidine kinase/response regulator [Pleurocapsa sp. CCALA 161]
MNSQDKPIDANDNFDESLSTSGANQQSEENSIDLWKTIHDEDAEIVTEFISAETATKNDAEALNNLDLERNDSLPKRKKSVPVDLDLDNWDFRNLDSTELESEPDLPAVNADGPDDWDEEVLVESLAEDEDIVVETSWSDSSNDLLLVEPDEAIANLAESLEPEVEAKSEMTMENIDQSSIADNDDELKLDNLENVLNNSALELSSEPLVEMNLADLGEADLLDLDAEPDLAIDSLQDIQEDSDSLAALADEGLDSLGNDLDELLSSTDNESFDDLVVEPIGGLDSLGNDLDDLLSSANNESLDDLVIEPVANLDSLASSIDSSDSLDLDSLLDNDPQIEPIAITPPPTPKAQPSVAKLDTPDASASPAFDQTMRVSVRKLDDLNNLIGELVVKRNRLEDDQERLRRFLDNLLGHVNSLGEAGAKMHDLYERSLLEGALMASRQSRANSPLPAGVSSRVEEKPQEQGLDALELDRFNGFHLLSQDIIELIVRVREAASDIQFVVDETDKVAQTFRQVTSQLQDGMNSSRMVAFGQTADRLPRAVRDISRKQKKQTNLHVEGKDVLIDKMIVEHIYNPMTHLVNNAISHGIEQPEVRLKQGKSEAGNVYIQAFIQGNQTVITVRDDGAGINPEIVKKKAVEKKLISWAAAQNLTEQQVYELLFHPGFSTKDEADDFAGRGVGMDVVNTDLKKIRGSVSTESQVGKGTIFTIRLPLVLSICKALICVDNNSQIAFPIDGVEDTKEYLPSDIQTNANGVRCISWQDTLLPLRPLNSLLNYNRLIRRAGTYNVNQNNDDTVSVVILRSLDNLLAIEVDEVRAEQEIVIKQIDGPIAKPPGIAGATVLGDGSIMPIGDVLELIEIAQGKRTIEIGFNILAGAGDVKQAQVESVQQEPMVLVVDDSITVRELLSMSFNKLGYRVEQARDGQEAWDKLRGGLECDMIFSDIEMPRMNGLELLSNLHQDSKLKSIPVAMLTSRGADKHRQIANDLGAKAYLTKPYTEKDLMDVAKHLIEINQANKETESTNDKANRINQSDSVFKDAPLVLIIDDSVTVRELLSMTFRNAGYRVEQARDGQEAWDKLSNGLECDIAFCDIEMPRMNGLELLLQLQSDEKLASLPIAMLTSRGAQKMRKIAAARGANGYFVKPYVEEDLLKAAKRMIEGETLIEIFEED